MRREPRLGHNAVEQLVRISSVRFVAVDARLGKMAADIAAAISLRGPDAVYVALAHRLNAPLVTWDHEQRNRATKVVRMLSPDEV